MANDMAPTHRWFDLFVDRGWPAVLTPAALRLILAVARRVDRSLQTRTKLARLMAESGLPPRTFHFAKSELRRYGLLYRDKIDGKWTIVLANAVPDPPQDAIRGTKRCNPLHKKVQPVAPADDETPRATRRNAIPQQKTEAQLEGQSSSSVVGVKMKSPGSGNGGSVSVGSASEAFLHVLGIRTQDVTIVARVEYFLNMIHRHPTRLDELALALSRFLQSRSLLIPEACVRAALIPDVQHEAHVLNGQVVEVRDG